MIQKTGLAKLSEFDLAAYLGHVNQSIANGDMAELADCAICRACPHDLTYSLRPR